MDMEKCMKIAVAGLGYVGPITNQPQCLSIFSQTSKPNQNQMNPNSLNLELNASKGRFGDQTIRDWLHGLQNTP